MWTGLKIAYHSACSLQHGQRLDLLPRMLLEQAGYNLTDIPEGHLCCGSAGTYNILEPKLSGQLRDRKLKNIESIEPDVIVTGNIGCMTQLKGGTTIPFVHTVELIEAEIPVPDVEGVEEFVRFVLNIAAELYWLAGSQRYVSGPFTTTVLLPTKSLTAVTRRR